MLKEITDKTTRVWFDDWAEYMDYAADTSGPKWRHRKSRTGTPHWSGTPDFAAAMRLAREGWPEGRAKITDGIRTAHAIKSTAVEAKTTYDVGGAYPDVPRFIAGDPAHMISPEPTEKAVKHIVRICLEIRYSTAIKHSRIINRGIAVLSCVDALEQAGHAVEIMIADGAVNGDTRCELFFPLKRAGEQWDADRAAFVLAHPSMLRRLAFSVNERQPECEKDLTGNYGMPTQTTADEPPGTIKFPPIGAWRNGGAERWGTLAEAIKTAETILREGGAPFADYDSAETDKPEQLAPTPAPAPTPPPPRTGREITARYPGKCKTCGARFERGARIIYRDHATHCTTH